MVARSKNEQLIALTEELQRKRSLHLEKITEFAQSLGENADYYFGWADRAMMAAAQERIHAITINFIQSNLENERLAENILAEVTQHAMNETLRYAQHPERSTSPSSNFMSQNRGVAWAEMLELLQFFKFD